MARKSMKPGGGGRFEALEDKLKSQGKSEKAAEAIAASAGRKKYGKKKMASFAAKGKKRAAKGKGKKKPYTSTEKSVIKSLKGTY